MSRNRNRPETAYIGVIRILSDNTIFKEERKITLWQKKV